MFFVYSVTTLYSKTYATTVCYVTKLIYVMQNNLLLTQCLKLSATIVCVDNSLEMKASSTQCVANSNTSYHSQQKNFTAIETMYTTRYGSWS